MISELNFLEVSVVVRELHSLIGTRLQKIYHPSKDELILCFYGKDVGNKILRITNRTLHLTGYKRKNPLTPTHFCMFLRKHLLNAVIRKITQLGDERIVRFWFNNEASLVVELFSQGNFILLKENTIIIPLRIQDWSHRSIRPKKEYLPPPSKTSKDLTYHEFQKTLLSSNKDIVRTLATTLNLGGVYAEETCLRASVNKNTPCKELSKEQLRKVYDAFKALIHSFDTASKGYCVYRGAELIDVTPVQLMLYSKNIVKEFNSFNEALDHYFTKHQIKELEQRGENEYLMKLRSLELVLEQQKNALRELKEKEILYRRQAEAIHNNLGVIQNIQHSLNKVKERFDWDKIKEIIKAEREKGVIEAELIKELIPERGEVVLDTDPEVSIDLRTPVTHQANELFELSKKQRTKIEGALNAIQETERKIQELKEKKDEIIQRVTESKPTLVVKKSRDWYEKFKWFFTTNDFLAITGKDATTNELLIRKHLEQEDLVFHADIPGSHFTVLKTGQSASQQDIEEASAFTVSNSKAWRMGVGAVNAYYVEPHQVSKTPPSGEYLARGSFMIRGKKNYVKTSNLELGVGVEVMGNEVRIIAGPLSSLQKHAVTRVVIAPGSTDTGTIANKIKELLVNRCPEDLKKIVEQIPLEEIQKFIPGESRIVY